MFYPSPRRYTAAELELIQQRADEARRPPYWPFAALTAHQAAAHAHQGADLRRRATPLSATAQVRQ
jgi:hypothetical protein